MMKQYAGMIRKRSVMKNQSSSESENSDKDLDASSHSKFLQDRQNLKRSIAKGNEYEKSLFFSFLQ
jgi:hypothetical protein